MYFNLYIVFNVIEFSVNKLLRILSNLSLILTSLNDLNYINNLVMLQIIYEMCYIKYNVIEFNRFCVSCNSFLSFFLICNSRHDPTYKICLVIKIQ